MEKDNDLNNQPQENELNKKKPIRGIGSVGINLLVLFFYTVLFKLFSGNADIIFDAFVIGFYVIFCLLMALLSRASWYWLLSAVLVLVIGFSTCTMFGNSLSI